MSINDLNNINFKQIHHYIQVNTPNTEKKAAGNDDLFNFDTGNNQTFFLSSGSNEYDDEQSLQQKKDNINYFL